MIREPVLQVYSSNYLLVGTLTSVTTFWLQLITAVTSSWLELIAVVTTSWLELITAQASLFSLGERDIPPDNQTLAAS